ncbi:TIFY8 [Arabidopsis thaliana]|jgi:hypothetical protein|uniref:TIFY8 n=1 Tax=Arabidopsis thaliana TaxID=3702 RepID=A0A178V5Q3_ARATH|nr:TIFY8 [Arabidopsis thaliana]
MMVNHNNGQRPTDIDSRLRQTEQDKLLFHDFLGSKNPTLASTSMADHRLPPDNKAAKAAMTPSTASASSAGGLGGLSSTSDLGSALSLYLSLLMFLLLLT